MRYNGGRHCGRIAFQSRRRHRSKAIECNCSLCSKRGHLLAFVPRDKFVLKTPEKDLSTYTFNTHRIRHQLLLAMRLRPVRRSESTERRGDGFINMRCIEGFEPEQVKIRKFDGRSK
jgi:hypothetical protein